MASIYSQQVKEACWSGISETAHSKFIIIIIFNFILNSRPLEKIEKQKDIYSLKSTREHMLIGCRDNSIIPMGQDTENLF
jgi:hypothetical protein